jgi:BirA family biotin operon repressor/biotin-[acetyl-CoA-carboxylase] ligase
MKDIILKYLVDSKGKYVSGGKIARELDISRSAVWKHIKQLKNEGYAIESITKKGYRLNEADDIISAVGIRKHLKTTSLGREILCFKSIDSTNTKLKTLAQKSEGLVVVSEEQTRGRGRRGKTFYSPKSRGIYFSILLKPDLPVDQSVFITIAMAVAAARGIEKTTGINCDIKWVNDLFIKEKKFGGILTEASMEMESQTLEYVIIGCGLNIASADYPKDISGLVTALRDETNESFSRNQLLAEIVNEFENLYTNLAEKTYLPEYKKRSNILGREIRLILPRGTETVEAIDIDDLGQLVVKKSDGSVKTLSTGEISIDWKN